MQRHHEEGGCNPEVIKHLSGGEPLEQEVADMNNPFAALKGLIK